jgi:hypothetical protein
VDDIVNHRERWRTKFGDKGLSPVPARVVYEELERIVEPARLGLERIRARLYGREVDADIVRVLTFQPYKGGAYGIIRWGVSLSFVPHDFERVVRFHRALRWVRFDLFEDALDVAGGDSLDDRVIHSLYGARVFRESAERAWRLLADHVPRWWRHTSTVAGDQGENVLSSWMADRREELGPRAVANLGAALEKVAP